MRICQQLENLHQTLHTELKRTVFEVVGRYLGSVGSRKPIDEIFVIYCKLTGLGYPEIRKLATMLLGMLREISLDMGKLPFAPYELFLLIKSICKKEEISEVDRSLFDLFVRDFGDRLLEIDSSLLIQTARGLLRMDMETTIGNLDVIAKVNKILAQAMKILESKGNLKLKKYIIESPANENPIFLESI